MPNKPKKPGLIMFVVETSKCSTIATSLLINPAANRVSYEPGPEPGPSLSLTPDTQTKESKNQEWPLQRRIRETSPGSMAPGPFSHHGRLGSLRWLIRGLGSKGFSAESKISGLGYRAHELETCDVDLMLAQYNPSGFRNRG